MTIKLKKNGDIDVKYLTPIELESIAMIKLDIAKREQDKLFDKDKKL